MSKREILRVIALLLLLTVTATVLLACKKKGQETPTPTPSDNSLLAPDYAPPAQEEGASDIEGEQSGNKLTPGAGGGGAAGLTYEDKASINLTTKKVTLRFENPSRSYNNIVLQMVLQDTLIFQSGLLTPGKKLTEIALADGIAERLQDGGYQAKFVVSFYDPDTNEKAIVNTELPITVDVSH